MTRRRRILVTGASGFVGGAYTRHLRALGHDVIGTVNSRRGHEDDVVVDVRTSAAFDVIPAGTFDVVIHAAALLGPERFSANTRKVNIVGTENALRFARERGATHFVQVSTIAAYGLRCVGENRDEQHTPITTSRWNPGETEYMRSKAEAERIVAAAGIPFTTLRLPVVIGAGSSFSAPAILGQLAKGIAPFTRTNARRVSVVCIGNVGPMMESVIEHGPAGRAFNTCDHHIAWRDLVEIYAAALGKPAPWVRRPLTDMLTHLSDPYYMFWLSNGMMGAHFPSDLFDAERPWTRRETLEEAVAAEVAAG